MRAAGTRAKNCDICVVDLSFPARFLRSVAGTAPAIWCRVAAPSTTYEPRCPAQTALYQIVRDHVETFRVQAACLRDGEGLPHFVDQEFRNFLQCGSLAGGFARFRCDECGLDRLVPFSCKARAMCPSCGGRRMTERAAHLHHSDRGTQYLSIHYTERLAGAGSCRSAAGRCVRHALAETAIVYSRRK